MVQQGKMVTCCKGLGSSRPVVGMGKRGEKTTTFRDRHRKKVSKTVAGLAQLVRKFSGDRVNNPAQNLQETGEDVALKT